MDERLRGQLEEFLRDERPALEELRRFVGGELSKGLDLSSRSLELLDRYLESLIEILAGRPCPICGIPPTSRSGLRSASPITWVR